MKSEHPRPLQDKSALWVSGALRARVSWRARKIAILFLAVIVVNNMVAQDSAPASPEAEILERAFPPPPDGFDKARDAIAHGKIELVEYDSKSVGNKRKALVYTPPGYSADTKHEGQPKKSFWTR